MAFATSTPHRSLSVISMVCIQSFGADVFAERIAQPGLVDGRPAAQFLRDVLQVEIEIVG